MAAPRASRTPPPSASSVVERRDDNGQLQAIVGLNSAGTLEGPFVAYDETGRAAMRLMCCDGRPDGPATVYRNGRAEVEMTFVAGQLGKEMRRFDAAGRVVSIVRFAAGRRHGLMECFSPEGRPVLTAEYRDDRLNGPWTEFRPDGSIGRRVQYRDDVLHGEALDFDANGQPIKRVLYAAGRIVEKPLPPAEPKAPDEPFRPWWRHLLGL